jgi:enoyl-CoA hydratase
MTAAVSVDFDAGLATVRLEREHGNALNEAVVAELAAAIAALRTSAAVRGVLLAARGKVFCPGLDLLEVSGYDRPRMAAFMDAFGALLVDLFTFPKPLVAALHGHTLAGGCILALTADWRVLARGALVGLNEIRAGVPLPFAAAQLLRAAVHPNRLEEVALLGRNYAAPEAVGTGLVHEVHDGADFEAHCASRLEEFASKDLAAFGRTKAYLRSATVERMSTAGERHAAEFLDCWFSASARRRIAAIAAELGKR